MNKQITEDYVSYEIAVLLKEKGFYEETEHELWYVAKQFSTGCHWNSCTYKVGDITREYDEKYCIVMPTHQMALKWLREVHDLHIIVYPWQADNEEKAIHWCCTVYKSFAHLGNDVYTNETPKSYEEAVEAACLYVLKNLI